jgi:hypothetical protein
MAEAQDPQSAEEPHAAGPNREGWSWATRLALILGGAGLCLAVIIPNHVRSRESASQNGCINNLREIDGAKQRWALANKKGGGDVPILSDIAVYLGQHPPAATAMTCFLGGSEKATNFAECYIIGAVTNPPQCKIYPQGHFLQ